MRSRDLIQSAKIAAAFAVCSTSITLSGCSSYAELIPFEQEKIEAEGTQPVPRCEWPKLNEGRVDGREVIYMETSDLAKQVACQETEQANHDIARDNAEAVDESVNAFNALVDKAKVHQQNAENELERVDDERQRKTFEVMGYQALILLGLIVSAL